MKKEQKILKVVIGIYGVAILIGAIAIQLLERTQKYSALEIFAKTLLLLFIYLTATVFLGIGAVCMWNAYRSVKKSMINYQEEPGFLAGDVGGSSGPSRQLEQKYDIIADKLWNLAAFGIIGALMLFAGMMMLKNYLIDPLIIFYISFLTIWMR